MNLKTMLLLSFFSPLLSGNAVAAVEKFKCGLVNGKEQAKITLQEGKHGTALDEPAASLQDFNGHKVGAFYYKDDSLGLVIDDSTNTTYNASKLGSKLLTFLSLRDGTEIKCHAAKFKGK